MLATIAPAPAPAPRAAASVNASTATTAHKGVGRFFATENFHFQALRALMEAPSGSADVNEILETMKTIDDGDVQGWYAAWSALGDRVLARAGETRDAIGRGNGFMRAHNYQRTAEFLLPPDDSKRPGSWAKCRARYDAGLEALGVACERIAVPYEGGTLRAHYFPGDPGAAQKPLVMLVGGFDSTLEELYPLLGKATLERGYAVLAYEGPGQGQALRDGMTFTPEWEKPTTAVLDAFLRTHARPRQVVLIGMSLGGYFAPRAAAFEQRIDGVVAWDTCFDFGEVAANIERMGRNPVFAKSVDYVWPEGNARWTLGTRSMAESVAALRAYTLAPVAARITQPVLIMAGTEDHAIPIAQTAAFEKSLINARSVTTRIFDRASGGGEHCQTGDLSVVHATIFDWLLDVFA
jgi:alpha-beta hydrolase superfamily lysophospholipase